MLALALLMVAAPVPPPKEPDAARIERLFGKPVDPIGDCQFRLGGDKLTIHVGPPARDLGEAVQARRDAPRTARTVQGDFTAQVWVSADIPNDQFPLTADAWWSHTAGLVVWAGAQNGVAFEVGRCAPIRHPVAPSRGFRAAAWHHDDQGAEVNHVNHMTAAVAAEAPSWLRLIREADRVRYLTSPDGREWVDRGNLKHRLPAVVSVGVTAGHRTGTGFAATFKDLRITPLPAEGRR